MKRKIQKNNQMQFDKLFKKALKDWPRKVLLKKIHYEGEYYSVDKLFLHCEKVTKRYLGKPEEVIMRNLHDAIFVTLHSAAKYLLSVEISKLRRETIKNEFERRINLSWVSAEDGWTDEDRALVQQYFKYNKVLSTHSIKQKKT